VDALYRDVLQYSGRDDAPTARRPSEAVWEDVAVRKVLTLSDAVRITHAQSERIARAA
jgi:hypothetical protein